MGHQNAVLAGLMEAKDAADITITIDCDGQDDICAIEKMVDAYYTGSEVVYGVRSNRDTDTFFKRITAEIFYKMLVFLGAEVVFNHADYRLISSKVLKELANFKEVNLFLRGMIPLVGFPSSSVYYSRHERFAGKSHYPLRKMLALAFDGISSLSIRPLRLITGMGMTIAILSFCIVVWSLTQYFYEKTVTGWTSMTSILCFIGGLQLICMGVLGEYIGKIYLEVKARPRYIIRARTYDTEDVTEMKNEMRQKEIVYEKGIMKKEKTGFDHFAEDYRKIHTKNVYGISGVDSSYFGEQKVKIIWKEILRGGGWNPVGSNIKILDFGCGDGINAVHFQTYFSDIEYFGIDISRSCICQAKKFAGDQIHFEVYDGKKIPYENNTFDIVFIACVLHHIPHTEHLELLAECKRVLKKGGYLYIFEHNPANPVTRKIVKDCVFDNDAELVRAVYLKRLLKKNGYECIKLSYTIFFPRKWIFVRLLWLEQMLKWLPLGGQYYIKCKK